MIWQFKSFIGLTTTGISIYCNPFRLKLTLYSCPSVFPPNPLKEILFRSSFPPNFTSKDSLLVHTENNAPVSIKARQPENHSNLAIGLLADLSKDMSSVPYRSYLALYQSEYNFILPTSHVLIIR